MPNIRFNFIKKKIILFLWFLLHVLTFSGIVSAQNTHTDNENISIWATRPNNPVTTVLPSLMINNLYTPQNSFTINYLAGNTWRPTLYLVDNKYGSVTQIRRDLHDPDGIISDRFCEACPTFDVPNNEAFNTAKQFRADGVVKALNVDWTRKVGKTSALLIHSNLHQLSGGGNNADFMVSDAFIEWFHKNFTPSKSDPFDRQKRPFNEAGIKFVNQKREMLRENDVWGGTFDIGFQHFWYVFDSEKLESVLKTAGIASLPLNSINQYMGASALIESVNVHRINNNKTMKYSFSAQYIHHNIIKLKNDIDFFDSNYRLILYFSSNYTFVKNKKSISFGAEFFDETPLLNEQKYSVFYETKLSEKGYYTSLSDMATWLLTTHNQYLSLYLARTQPIDNYLLTSGLRVTEDGHFLRSGIAFVKNGSNGQDIGIEVFMKFSW